MALAGFRQGVNIKKPVHIMRAAGPVSTCALLYTLCQDFATKSVPQLLQRLEAGGDAGEMQA